MTFKSISQISNDSITCVPNNKLRSAIKKIEECKIIKEQYALSEANNEILLSRIIIKDSIIANWEKKDSICELRNANSERMLKNLNSQIDINKKIHKVYMVLARKRQIITGAVGILVGIIGGIIIAK